ncbi:UNVERIFIED_CONTAM: hypothetical protein NCL1_23377 [Trichonephila clavipes]
MKCALFCTVAVLVLVYCQAASQSQSCVWSNGQLKCSTNTDPNGNAAVAYGGTDGQNSQIYTGQNYPPNFNPNFNPNFGNFGGMKF